jgi:hypothetical protein
LSRKEDGENYRTHEKQADHPRIAASDDIAEAIGAINHEIRPEEEGGSQEDKGESGKNKQAHACG